MKEINQTHLDLSQKILGRLMENGEDGFNDHFTLDIWEWAQGVGVYGVYKLYEKTQDNSKLEFLEKWFEGHIARGLPVKNVNTMAPMLCMACVYQKTHNEAYLPLIREWANWIMHDMPRTEQGGLQHITSDSINTQQLWDDTLYMTVLFLYQAGIILKDKAMTEEAKYQFLLHIAFLRSAKNGLWYHGFCFEGRHHFGEAFWARGNSWFTSGGVDFLEMLDQHEERDSAYALIKEALLDQVRALVALQDASSGLWHTLLDHPDSYLETSAAAGIAYGLLKGIRTKLLPESYLPCAQKAVAGVLQMVDEKGTVGSVSYGTPMGHDLDFYRNIPICPTAYGQGLAFLMLTELI